jgi:hypothetical protein
MDDAREVLKQCNIRVMQAEAALLFLDDKRKAFEKRLEQLAKPVKMEGKLIEQETWISALEIGIKQARDDVIGHEDKITQLGKKRESMKLENELPKKTIEELTAGKEEEDPEERIIYTSHNEEVPVEEWKKRKAIKETYPLACYGAVKRR